MLFYDECCYFVQNVECLVHAAQRCDVCVNDHSRNNLVLPHKTYRLGYFVITSLTKPRSMHLLN